MITTYLITHYCCSPGYWLTDLEKYQMSSQTNPIMFLPTVKETCGMATFIFSNAIILHAWWLGLYQVKYSDIL